MMSSRTSIARISAYVAATLTAGPAFAAGSNMPWEQPLQQILQSIEGPVSKIVAVIIIIVTGLTLAFGDTAGGFRRSACRSRSPRPRSSSPSSRLAAER
jgi:type IV secretion system protein TrbC